MTSAMSTDHRSARRLAHYRSQGQVLRDVLREEVSLAPAPTGLFELLSYIPAAPQREKARALAQGEIPMAMPQTLD